MNVAVAGGKNEDLALLKGMGVNVVQHWNKLGDLSAPSLDVDLAVVISEDVSLLLVRQLEEVCKREQIPVVKTGQTWEKFSLALKNPEQFLLDKNDEVLYPINRSTYKESTMNKNTERAQQKLALAREILSKNRFAKTEDIQAQVVKVFGKKITPSAINDLRLKEFKVKAGARGRFFDANGKMLDVSGTPAQVQPVKAPALAQTANNDVPDISTEFGGHSTLPTAEASEMGDKLTKLVSDLRAEMGSHHVRQLSIPARGPVRAVFEAQFTIQ